MNLAKNIILVIIFISSLDASQLENKYDVYTEYLGLENLNLTENQLMQIVPKLEKKMQKDKLYKKYIAKQKVEKKILRESKKMSILDKLNKGGPSFRDIQQFICFTSLGILSQDQTLKGGCKGRTLTEMNRDGYELIQVISGLNSSFGLVFTKKSK